MLLSSQRNRQDTDDFLSRSSLGFGGGWAFFLKSGFSLNDGPRW